MNILPVALLAIIILVFGYFGYKATREISPAEYDRLRTEIHSPRIKGKIKSTVAEDGYINRLEYLVFMVNSSDEIEEEIKDKAKERILSENKVSEALSELSKNTNLLELGEPKEPEKTREYYDLLISRLEQRGIPLNDKDEQTVKAYYQLNQILPEWVERHGVVVTLKMDEVRMYVQFEDGQGVEFFNNQLAQDWDKAE